MTSHSHMRRGKRLLVASIGLATVTYAAAQSSGCTDDLTTSGNLVAPPQQDANVSEPDASMDAGVKDVIPNTGNLLPPPPLPMVPDAGVVPTGNLMPPPEMDAGEEEDAGYSHMRPTGNLMPPPPATRNE